MHLRLRYINLNIKIAGTSVPALCRDVAIMCRWRHVIAMSLLLRIVACRVACVAKRHALCDVPLTLIQSIISWSWAGRTAGGRVAGFACGRACGALHCATLHYAVTYSVLHCTAKIFSKFFGGAFLHNAIAFASKNFICECKWRENAQGCG